MLRYVPYSRDTHSRIQQGSFLVVMLLMRDSQENKTLNKGSLNILDLELSLPLQVLFCTHLFSISVRHTVCFIAPCSLAEQLGTTHHSLTDHRLWGALCQVSIYFFTLYGTLAWKLEQTYCLPIHLWLVELRFIVLVSLRTQLDHYYPLKSRISMFQQFALQAGFGW